MDSKVMNSSTSAILGLLPLTVNLLTQPNPLTPASSRCLRMLPGYTREMNVSTH